MAVDKLVDSTQLDADLTSVANAIRTKGGTSAQMAFPAGFVSAVNAIPTGSGYTIDQLLTADFSGEITTNATGIFGLLEDSNITGFYAPNVTQIKNSIGSTDFSLANSKLLTAVYMPLLTAMESRMDLAFYGCSALSNVNFDSVQSIGTSSFQNCTSLVVVVFPGIKGNVYTSAFQGCTALKTVDMLAPSFARASIFSGCTSLENMILRNTESLCSLTNINVFVNTPFASGGTGGKLYVPQSLISSYQSATNWSTILGYPNNQILPIEGSVYETKYADGRTIPTT